MIASKLLWGFTLRALAGIDVTRRLAKRKTSPTTRITRRHCLRIPYPVHRRTLAYLGDIA